MVLSPQRLLALIIGMLGALTIVAPADASHLKGGSLAASISATDQLTVDVHWAQRGSCTVGASTYNPPLTVTAPGGATQSLSASVPASRCLGQTSVFDGPVTLDLDDATVGFGPTAPDGVYTITLQDCCRTGGIVNSSSSSVSLTATVHHVAGTATASPRFIGATAAGASQGFAYSGDVTAVDPDEPNPLTYGLLQSANPGDPFYEPNAPATNVVALSGSTVTASAMDTAGWSLGSYFAFGVDAASSDEHVSSDVLVKVTSNLAPVLDPVPTTFEVTAGEQGILPITASDPDSGNTVTITAGGAPSWVTFTATPGNPASAQLVAAPPLGVEGTFLFAVDAADDDADAFLQDTKIVRVHVSAPPVAELPPAETVTTPTPAATVEPPAAAAAVIAPAIPAPDVPRVPLTIVGLETGTDGLVTATLTVPGPGTIDVTGTGTVNEGGRRGAAGGSFLVAGAAAHRSLKLVSRRQAVAQAGTVTVDFRLDRGAIRTLALRGLLRVRFAATYTPADGGPTVQATKAVRLKAFTLMTIGKPQLVSDGRRLVITVRVPHTGRLWAKVSADHDGGVVKLGRTTTTPVRRGEAILNLDVSNAEAQHVLSEKLVPLHITGVLDAGDHRQTRTRTVLLVR